MSAGLQESDGGRSSMYGYQYPVGAIAAGGTVAALSGWNALGWVLLGASVLVATGMTFVRLRRQ